MSDVMHHIDTPLRPQASPRSSRSARSSVSVDDSPERSEANSDSSEGQSPTRGRGLVRIPAIRSTNRRSTTIHQDRPAIKGWNYEVGQQRLMSRDLTAEPQDIFGSVQAPLPFGVERDRSSLSEELYKAATWDNPVDVSRFGNHRDTFAIMGLRHLQSHRIGLPMVFFERLFRYIDFSTYLAIRLSCRCWSEAVTKLRPIAAPPVYRLPTELLEKIFFHLDPLDFDAARHTCRFWMITSLEERLLTLMLRRGGWWAAAKADINLQEEFEGTRTAESISEEWMLSKRLATECSLKPDWTGTGLADHLISTSLCSNTTIDFSELSNGRDSSLQFTVSVCNKFILVTEGYAIYVYSIQDSGSGYHQDGGHLSPLTTVMCPHRVLAVSMDTSSQRFAVAALLEGRIGMVCDISETSPAIQTLPTARDLPFAVRNSRDATHSHQDLKNRLETQATHSNECTTPPNAHDRTMARAIAEATLPEIRGARNTQQSWTMNDPFLTPLEASGFSQDSDIPDGHMPVASGPHSIYRDLCSSEDPPRSIAICPQRRCVAFGCAAGIELHWIDVLTGQDFNRWFPLTAPSDFLFFLSPRSGIDSAKKIRLISSAAHPKERKGTQRGFSPFGDHGAARYRSMTWDEEVYGTGFGSSAWRGSGGCDHYQAVPVSDGWNVLFTDPKDGMLCLGSDAPPGARATKLSKRFTFVGPTNKDGDAILPTIYSSGVELRWGVRVAVGYGDSLWIFVVPPDLYFTDGMRVKMDAGERVQAAAEAPIKLSGVEIGRVPGLVDVAIDASAGDLTIWAFAAHGSAYLWQIGGKEKAQVVRFVRRDGAVMPAQDFDGDTYTHNTSSSALDLDGNASLPTPAQNSEGSQFIDTVMRDAGDEERSEREFEAAGGSFAIRAPPLWGRWSEEEADWVPDYLGERWIGSDDDHDDELGVNVLEMSRLEVEILDC